MWKNIKDEIRELEQQTVLIDGVLGYSEETKEQLAYLYDCDPKPYEKYPPTMPASNGCSVRGCDRRAGTACGPFGHINGRYHRDLCGDHSAAETMLGR
jgi:hypothetical protein